MTRRPLLSRRLVVVTGKGGVGKTTVAAALCRRAANEGQSVLACAMDGRPALAGAIAPDRRVEVGFDPVALGDGISAMAMETEASLREYLRLYARIPSFVSSIAPLAAVFDYAATAAPGVREILAVGKICHEVREARHDIVVVDAEATGHVLGQLTAPRTLQQIVSLGMIRDQTAWMSEILEDPVTTSVVVVAVPEDLAVTEACELIASLEGPASIDVGAVLCNKMPPAALTAAEERDAGLVRSLDGLANGEISRRGDCLGDAVARFSAARARRTSAVARASRLRACAGEAAFAVVAAAHHDPVATVAAAIAEEAL